MGMFYPRQYFMRNQESPKIVQIEGLPPEVLQGYNVEIKEGEKTQNCWQLKDTQQSYALWEYTGDSKTLEIALQWQKYVREQGFSGFSHVYKTKEGGNHLKREKNSYYLTDWFDGIPFDPQKNNHLLELAETLSELHFYSKDFKIPVLQHEVEPEFSWLKAKQEKLTELLTYYQYLKEQRLTNDYERLYIESFEDFYKRGQEAIQKMVLAGCNPENQGQDSILVGNLLAENILKTDKGIIILSTTYWKRGVKVSELALLLRMYLPLKQWDWELGQAILAKYQEKNPLQTKEKWLFLAQLGFPSRFWIYTYRYFYGDEEISDLTEKFKQYLYETTYRQDECLEKLEKWLLGSETK